MDVCNSEALDRAEFLGDDLQERLAKWSNTSITTTRQLIRPTLTSIDEKRCFMITDTSSLSSMYVCFLYSRSLLRRSKAQRFFPLWDDELD